MTNEEVTAGLTEVKESVAAQTAGLVKMLGVLATQTALLREILQAVTAEPEGESPLVQALQQLIKIGESHTAALARIERSVTTPGPA